MHRRNKNETNKAIEKEKVNKKKRFENRRGHESNGHNGKDSELESVREMLRKIERKGLRGREEWREVNEAMLIAL